MDKLLKDLQKLNKTIVRIRENRVDISKSDLIWHQLVEADELNNRLIVILNSRGCTYAVKGQGPCFNCGLVTASSHGHRVLYKDFEDQFEKILSLYKFDELNITELDLFNAGSLLDDWQIETDVRLMLFRKIASINNINNILIDSRSEDVTKEKLLPIKKIIGNKELWVGIGIETYDDTIRNLCINKDSYLVDFKNAVSVLKICNANLFTYLMFKPAFLTEYEAIEDAKKTIRHLTELSKQKSISLKISFEPGVVQGDCLLTHLYSKGFYRPPWLWSVVKVIIDTHKFTNGCLRVGIPEEIPKIIARRRNYNEIGSTCSCSFEIEACIRNYNKYKSLDVFEGLPKCSCRKIWDSFLVEERNRSKMHLKERIRLILDSVIKE